MIAELDRGTSFDKVVAARSIEKSAGTDGSLGWLTENQMLEPFAVMVRSLARGTYARQPVQAARSRCQLIPSSGANGVPMMFLLRFLQLRDIPIENCILIPALPGLMALGVACNSTFI